MRSKEVIIISIVVLALVAGWRLTDRDALRLPTMNSSPTGENTTLIRTDFSNAEAWKTICTDVCRVTPEAQRDWDKWREVNALMGQRYPKEPPVFVDLVDNRKYADLTTEQLLEQFKSTNQSCLFVADNLAISNAEHPILVVDLLTDKRGRTFRAIPSRLSDIGANLSVGNMGWEDFANHVDADGVFRH